MANKLADLRGYVCLVTGASRGIGRGIAIGLGECGATVYITARTVTPKGDNSVPGSLEETAEEVNARGGIAIPVAVDHSDDSQVANLFARIRREQKGRLDILVNNVFAGAEPLMGNIRQQRTYWELGPDETPGALWDSVNRVGLRNHYICSVLGTRMMLDYRDELNQESDNNSTQKSSESLRPGKSAIDRMAADMAIELKERGKNIAVMSIWPGLVRTEQMTRFSEENGAISSELKSQSESVELTGRVLAAIAKESRNDLMARSGRTIIVADAANSFGIVDVDGRAPLSFRSYKFLLNMTGWKRLASFVPAFLKVPYCLLKPASPRF